MAKLLAEFVCNDMAVQYRRLSGGLVGLVCFPASMAAQAVSSADADPLVEIRLSGDDFMDGFSNGTTLRGSGCVRKLRYESQHTETADGLTTIHTAMQSDDGIRVVHHLSFQDGERSFLLWSTLENQTDSAVTLELLTSFSIGAITPFAPESAAEGILLHRFRSYWSAEGRHEALPLEALELVPSWSGYGVRCERFGQRGSMPVRGYFPWIGAEDTQAGVCWCANLYIPGSWQMEAVRRGAGLSLSGGLADYDFGHWKKTLRPGDRFDSPLARITTARAPFDACCQRLVCDMGQAMQLPQRLPVLFNEFCTSWGNPSQQNIAEELRAVRAYDMDYFIIDAGWYADDQLGWGTTMGDWEVNRKQFPSGLSEVVKTIRDAGLKPGIWFEFECCGRDARAFHLEDHLLKRDGKAITVGVRRFWDLRDAWTRSYLQERVTGMLRTYGFAYLKIDYNDSIGIGCDGAESLGEGLRQHLEALEDFIRGMKQALPDVVIENCSSGGHRLEPSMLSLCEYASFSDAHEQKEIPVIAANLHRLIPPKQSAIWVVIRKADTPRELAYKLASSMLGVMCLSGDIGDLSAEQQALVVRAIGFYRLVSDIITEGQSEITQCIGLSWRPPKGWQAVLRENGTAKQALLVVHTFQLADPSPIAVAIPEGYRISAAFYAGAAPAIHEQEIRIAPLSFTGYAFLLEK